MLTHTSPNIYIFKLSLRWKPLTHIQTIKSHDEVGCLEAPQHWLWTMSPLKCYSLWVAVLIFSKHRTGGAGLLLKAQSVRHTWVPKADPMDDGWSHTPDLAVWGNVEQMSMGQLRSRNQAAQPQGFVPEHRDQPCFWPQAGETASPYSSGRCQLWPELPPGADSPVPVKGGGLFAGAEPLSVCCPMGSLSTQLPNHLVWEAQQPTHLSLQPFPRNYFHFFSPNWNKTLPQTLFVRQNHTWAGIWGLTQSFQQMFPQDSPRQGFWKHHHD